MSDFQDLLSRHIGLSLLKQEALGEFLGDHNWAVDLNLGTVDFGQGRVYPMQIIGTEAEDSGTWMWAWANTQSNIPPQLLLCANALRELGERESIAELTQPQVELDHIEGHLLAMVASGVCEGDAYYRGPYPGGAIFFLIQQSPLRERVSASPMKLVNTISSVISQFPVAHKRMALSLLEQNGYALAESGSQVTATREGNEITVSFDELERVANMQTTLKPEPKKPWWKLS